MARAHSVYPVKPNVPAPEVLRPRAVLFDFDGTLAETETLGLELDEEAFSALGISVTPADARSIVGTDGIDSVQALLDKYGHPELTPADFERVRESSDAIYQVKPLQIMEGARELLAALKAQGLPLGLVSSTTVVNLTWALDRSGLMGFFDVVVGGDMVAAMKPAPDPYLLALRFLAMEPGEVVAVDDSPVGIASAQGAGLPVVAFKGSVIEQDTSAADYALDSFEGLRRFLTFEVGARRGSGMDSWVEVR